MNNVTKATFGSNTRHKTLFRHGNNDATTTPAAGEETYVGKEQRNEPSEPELITNNSE